MKEKVLEKLLEHLEVYNAVDLGDSEIFEVRLKTEELFGTGTFYASVRRDKKTGEMSLVDFVAEAIE